MTVLARLTIITAIAASPLAAQTVDPMQAAIDSGLCGEAGVASATYDAATNTVSATCNEDVEGFLPLIGGLGPALAAGGAAVVLAAAAGGGSTSDTQ